MILQLLLLLLLLLFLWLLWMLLLWLWLQQQLRVVISTMTRRVRCHDCEPSNPRAPSPKRPS